MPNFLDLRKKIEPQVVVVEKIILKPRSFFGELARMIAVIAIVSISVWGISFADISNQKKSVKNFNAIGIVSDIATTTISMNVENEPSEGLQTSYTFDTSAVTKIQSKGYVPLTLSDISIGDKIGVQGLDDGTSISILRIISFSATSSKEKIPEIATSTATTTDDLASSTPATTTPDVVASSTDATNTQDVSALNPSEINSSSTPATTTPDVVASSTSATTTIIQTIIDTASNTVQNVVNAVTGGGSDTPPVVPVVTPPPSDPTPPVP